MVSENKITHISHREIIGLSKLGWNLRTKYYTALTFTGHFRGNLRTSRGCVAVTNDADAASRSVPAAVAIGPKSTTIIITLHLDILT